MARQPGVGRLGFMPFTVVLSPEDSGFSVFCPAMNIASQGDDRDHALTMIGEAMTLWLEVAGDEGYALAPETPEMLGKYIAEVIADRALSGQPPVIELTQVTLLAAVAAA